MAAALLAITVVAVVVAAQRVPDLTRRDSGDIFTLLGENGGAAQCAEHGAGARTFDVSAEENDSVCVCPQRAPLFREDRELCVDDLPECSLATFGTGNGVQRIPFVFLPLKGQIIHPSREITFQGVKTPICAVSGAQFLTRKGFVDLRNTLDADVPFSLFRDEGRTFLQWSGEDELRVRMSGRVMLVRLLCRDVAATPASPLDLRGVFTPCVAFRVQGTPPRHISNVTEVQFAPNAHTSDASTTSGLSVTEYVAIGISSLLLGSIYVASVFLYLHIRKRRKAASEEDTNRRLKGLKKKDGSVITEHDIIRINNERMPTITNPITEDDGVVKKNPLMSMGRQFHEIKSSFPSDSGSNISDSEDLPDDSNRSEHNRFNNQTTSVQVHPCHRDSNTQSYHAPEPAHRDESGIERLPDEHVSIVETTDEREIARPVGTTRRKLYFNSAYFEPSLMADPPPAALEFLIKIREVIAIAKHKMAAKRFQPILNEIPEEETYPSTGNSIDCHGNSTDLASQRSGSAVSLKRDNSRKKSIPCVGCPGCKSDDGSNSIPNFIKYDVPPCSNCQRNKGDKQNSIRQWLENIPTVKQQPHYNEILNANQNNSLINSLLSLPTQESKCKVRKQGSFSVTKQASMRSSDNFYVPKRSSTLSVRSEPQIRNYNLPLPDFENVECNHKKYYGKTISRIEDIRPIELNNYCPGNTRRSSIANTNKNILPDMVNEAIALEHCSKSYHQNSSDEERFYKKITSNAIPKPIMRMKSESPPGDYETDSLERMSNKKGVSTPTEYLDVPSSQASPSLSSALPLEEELTMRNAVYKSSKSPTPFREIKTNHYETIENNHGQMPEVPPKSNGENKDYSLVSEVYVNNNYNFGSTPTSPSGSEYSMGSRKFFAENNPEEIPGSLTIEVKDCPDNYIKIHESDDFEPDTLDRKQQKQKEVIEKSHFSRKDFIKNLNSTRSPKSERIMLRSSGTFKKTNSNNTKFSSLRHMYEQGKNCSFERPIISTDTFSKAKSVDGNTCEKEEPEDWISEEGRILTLELRHSKRQRQCTPPTIKQIKSLARPDILPPLPPVDDTPIYEQPAFPPRRVESETVPIVYHPKNLNGRSLSPRTFMNNTTIEQVANPNSHPHLIVVESPCSASRASVRSHHSDYENIITYEETAKNDVVKSVSRKRPGKSFSGINTNTFVKPHKDDFKARLRRKKGPLVEDSGYLSSDSGCSRQVRRIVVPKIVSCSESDDSENEACSESGAESVETHSVFFGSLRKLQASEKNNLDKRDIRNSGRSNKVTQQSA